MNWKSLLLCFKGRGGRNTHWGLALAIAFGCVGTAHAYTLTVTRFDDPAPNGCVDGDCSLREAAKAASNHVGSVVIQLSAGTYTLVRGRLAFAGDVQLIGAGSAQTHVVTGSRLFDDPKNGSLLVRGMSVQTTSDYVLHMTADSKVANLTLDDVAVPTGGGVVSVASVNGFAVTLDIRDSDLRTVYCHADVGTCTIVNSQLSSLESFPANDPGATIQLTGTLIDGALDPANANTGMNVHRGVLVDIKNSAITHAGFGLRGYTYPLLVRLDRLNYSGNSAPVRFGIGAGVEITDSQFETNSSRAIYAENDSTWTISGSSFVANTVDGHVGGAIVVEDATNVHIENSTFSGNTFSAAAAQGGARGAAIGYRNGSGLFVELQHVTIVPPSFAPAGIDGLTIGGDGGTGGVIFDINNSILAGSCKFDAGDLHGGVGNIQSLGTTCDFNSAFNQVNVSNADLAIGLFGDHGGPTGTYEPAVASVAVDRGDASHCPPLDQRKFSRPAGATCDVGAVEVGGDDTLFANGFD